MRRKLVVVVFVGVGAALTACKRPPDIKPLAPIGSVIQNGLCPKVYWNDNNSNDLEARLKEDLADNTGVLNSGFGNILDSPGGDTLVTYAVDCAIDGTFKLTGTSSSFSTTGHLELADQWNASSNGLASQSNLRAQVHTCVAIRLNPTGQSIPIWAEGGQIKKTLETPAEYSIEEARWAASIGNNQVRIQVWPSAMLERACKREPGDVYTRDVLNTRVCSKSPGTCNLDKLNTTPPSSAILTRVRCQDFCTLYPECDLPEECQPFGFSGKCDATPPPFC